MNDNELKSAWRETAQGFGNGANAPQNITDLCTGKHSTTLDRLRNRYLRFALASMICCPLSLMFLNRELFPYEHAPVVTIAFILYMLTASVMDCWLFQGIGSIDCLHMSVSEVYAKAMYYRRKHLQFMMVLIPMAAIVVSLIVWFVGVEPSIVFSMICGAAVGLLIGLRQFRAFMRDYRNLSE